MINRVSLFSTYGFAHEKKWKADLFSNIVECVPNIDIIQNDFWSLFYSTIKNWVKFI